MDDPNKRDQSRAEEGDEVRQLADGAERAADEIGKLRKENDEKGKALAALSASGAAGDAARTERRGHLKRGLEALRRVGIVAIFAFAMFAAGALVHDAYSPGPHKDYSGDFPASSSV